MVTVHQVVAGKSRTATPQSMSRHSGEPDKVDKTCWSSCSQRKLSPSSRPIAQGANGETFNVNATPCGAVPIAGALGAKALLLLTTCPACARQ